MEGLGARIGGASDRPAVVVDRNEGPRLEGVGDGGSLPDAHVEVPAPGQGDRVAEVFEGQLGQVGDPEVEVAFDDAVGADRAGLGPAMPGVEEDVDAVEEVAPVEEDLGAAGRGRDPPVPERRDDGERRPVEQDDARGQIVVGGRERRCGSGECKHRAGGSEHAGARVARHGATIGASLHGTLDFATTDAT